MAACLAGDPPHNAPLDALAAMLPTMLPAVLSMMLPMVLETLSAMLLMLVASAGIESQLTPTPKPLIKRDWQSTALAALTLISLFGLYLTITRRPWLSGALTAGLPALLTLVSRVKYRHLHEPMIYTDWRYFQEALRYPSLYLPYFGWWRAAGLLVSFIMLLVTWWLLEAAQQAALVWIGVALMGLAWPISLALVTRWPAAQRYLNPEADLMDWGGLAMHRVYRHQLSRPVKVLQAPFVSLQHGPNRPPDVVVIQAESFIDRRHWAWSHELQPAPKLPGWQQLQADAWRSGLVDVPAWGANTQRSEFAMLSGLDPKTLGAHRFDPYRSLLVPGRFPAFIALPQWLKSKGYQTTFVHPYLPGFYSRDRVIPSLGFDTFLDIDAFASAHDPSRYISDAAVGHTITNLLNEGATHIPQLIYAVTMQGHGPYGAGHLSGADLLANYDACMLALDDMLAEIYQTLQARDHPAVLCVFGDHPPMLPELYAAHTTPPPQTDYVIWRHALSQVGCETEQTHHAPIALHELALHVLKASGFKP